MEPTLGEFAWITVRNGFILLPLIAAAALVRLALAIEAGGDEVTPQKIAKSLWWQMMEGAKIVTAVAAALSILGSLLWFFLRDRAQEAARDLAGTTAIIAAVDGVRSDVAEQRTMLADLGARVDRLEPEPVVVVFDPLRSWIERECRRGAVCRAAYFARRADTEYGRTCGAPESVRVFIDAVGIEFAPDRSTSAAPRRLSERASYIELDFIVPERAAAGVGEFFLRVTYPDCGEAGDKTITAETMRLVTNIVE